MLVTAFVEILIYWLNCFDQIIYYENYDTTSCFIKQWLSLQGSYFLHIFPRFQNTPIELGFFTNVSIYIPKINWGTNNLLKYRVLQIVQGGKVLQFSQIDQYRETFPVK